MNKNKTTTLLRLLPALLVGASQAWPASGGDDDHGNSRSTATPVALPSTTTGTIDPGNDTDWFRFEAPARGAVAIESSGDLDTLGTLFDTSGNRIVQNDDGAGYPNFRIKQTLDAGTYYVRVHSSGRATGGYSLHLRMAGDDDHGNTPPTATPVSLPSTTAGTLDTYDDEDYFVFEVSTNGSLSVVVESSGDLDVTGALFNASGSEIALSYDGGTGLNFRIDRALDAGIYYVRVDSYAAVTGAYTLHLRVRDHGDTRFSATGVALPSTTASAIDPVEDEDWFRFEVPANGTVEIESSGDLDVVGTLFDASGNQHTLDDDGGTGSNFRMEVTLDAGTYYVRVHSYAAVTGSYTLYLRPGSDDHGNTRSTATGVVLPSRTASTIDPGEDEDYFRFEVSASGVVEIESSGDLDVVGTLFDASGNRIEVDHDGGAGSNFRIEVTLDAGTYYVRVHSYSSVAGAYTLHLYTHDGNVGEGAGSDDHGNTRSTATRISLPSTTAGTIDPMEDEDWFRFEVSANGGVVVEWSGDPDLWFILWDASRNIIGGGGGSNYRGELMLEAGTYYARVYSREAIASYTLTLRELVVSDDHGNTRFAATRVSLPSATAGTIYPRNDVDHFRFDVPVRGVVGLDLTGLVTKGTLFDVRGSRIGGVSGDRIGNARDRLPRLWKSFTLDAGTYYVSVLSDDTGSYTLHLESGAAGLAGLRISTSTGYFVQPFQTVPLAVEGGTEGADYDILVDLSGTGVFKAEDTIEVAPVEAATDGPLRGPTLLPEALTVRHKILQGDLLMAAPLPETLANGNTARLFAVRVRERDGEATSAPLTLTLAETNVPPSLAGYATVILDVVLEAVYEDHNDRLMTAEAGAIEPGRSVRTARALGLSTAFSDAQAEALLRSFGGVSLVEPGAAASADRSVAVRCEGASWRSACDAYRRLANCVGDAIDGFESGDVSKGSLDHCAAAAAGKKFGFAGKDYYVRSAGNFLRRAAPRLARTLGVGSPPAQQLFDLNATVRQVVGANKAARPGLEHAKDWGGAETVVDDDDLRDTYESIRDASKALTEGNAELVVEAEQETVADGVDDAERDAYFALVEEADHHQSDAAAIEKLEDVYTGEVDMVGRPAEGGGATQFAICGLDYEEFSVDDRTSTCVWNSLVEWNCYTGSRHVNHPDLGGASACLYYSLDFSEADGTCRENYAKVPFLGRDACRWADLGADKAAWYTLEKEQGVKSPQSATDGRPSAGGAPPSESFRDCDACPSMVSVSAGSFLMGAPESEPHSDLDEYNERPQRTVSVPAFAMGAFEVTFAEWDACVAEDGCGGYSPDDLGWGRGDRPVINVNWNDAQLYVEWLSRKTGQTYRLPTEAEWEYAARAGTTTPFNTGDTISPHQANFDGRYRFPSGFSRRGINRGQTVPVGWFAPNAFSLYDTHGNVSEWVQDCGGSYENAPTDGSAFEAGRCGRVIRGGSFVPPFRYNSTAFIRSASRAWPAWDRDIRRSDIGFRVVRALAP